MIESAVASILMRLPVAELSTLRKVFMASRGGLTLESFVAAMLESKPSCLETTVGRRASVAYCRKEDAKPDSKTIKKTRKRRRARKPSQGRQQQPACGHRSGEPKVDEIVVDAGGGKPRQPEKTQPPREVGKGAREVNEARSLWKGVECSLTDEEKVAMVVNLIELFRQVDHNDDKVMEWEEFTGFVIDQVLALTTESPHDECLKRRRLGSRFKLKPSRAPVRKVRYVPQLGRVLVCAGPLVQVWDPFVLAGDAKREAARRVEGFLAHSPAEAHQGFEVGSSVAISDEEDKRRLANGGNINSSNRESSSSVVFVMDIKYVEAHHLFMVLRSDLTIAFFSADTYVRLGLLKTPSQQYVLEHCPVTDLSFSSGCDGTILSFAIEAHHDADQQMVKVTTKSIGVLRRHTDIVQEILAVNCSEVDGGQRLVSCGLDRAIYVWDIAKGEFVQSKHGNRATIRSIAFDPSSNLLLGAGIEDEAEVNPNATDQVLRDDCRRTEWRLNSWARITPSLVMTPSSPCAKVLVWDMWSQLGSPLFRMEGHRAPVLSVACATGKGRAVSLDESGRIILWDTRKNAAVDSNQRHLCRVDASANHPSSLDAIWIRGSDVSRWSHIGVSVVTTGRHMEVFDTVDPRVSEPALSVAIYSPKCLSFVICNGPFVTLWDACIGKPIRSDKACEGDILCASFDSCERRVILASSLGEIVVFAFLQGTRIRSLSPRHNGPASGLVYVSEDKVIVTGGWDRSLRVYDDIPREGDPPLLRQVDGAHSSDINCVVVSQRLGLIASGAADGSCCLWDLQFLTREGSCVIGDEVLCMCFLEPFPLLVVGDAGGYISIVPVRFWLGRERRYTVSLRFANDQVATGTIEGPAAVTIITFRSRLPQRNERTCTADVLEGAGHPSIQSSAGLDALGDTAAVIYVGDDKGVVRAWDLLRWLQEVECHAVPEYKLPRSKNNYDMRRRFHRQAKQTEGRTRREDPRVEPQGQPERSGLDRRCTKYAPSWKVFPPIFSEVEGHAREPVEETRPARSVDYTGTRGTLKDNTKVVVAAERRTSREAGGNGRENILGSSCCHVGEDERRLSYEAPNDMDGASRRACPRDLREMDGKSRRGGDPAEEHARSGVVLIGEWVPHTEAVLSLEVIDDPFCLLTASRDRSVKLRALPTDREDVCVSQDAQSHNPINGQISIQKDRDTQQMAAPGEAHVRDRVPLTPRAAIADANGDGDGYQGRETDEENEDVGERSVAPKMTVLETGVSDAESAGAGGCGDLDDSCQTTGKSLRKHGRDLSTLTLGRIEDGFRRDRYNFPVDLKGRGYGRAAEARAVMQAIDEIERRREKKRKENEEVARARGAAAMAAAATTKAKGAVSWGSPSGNPEEPTNRSKAEGPEHETTGEDKPESIDSLDVSPVFSKKLPPPGYDQRPRDEGPRGVPGKISVDAGKLGEIIPGNVAPQAKQKACGEEGAVGLRSAMDVAVAVATAAGGTTKNSVGEASNKDLASMYENMTTEMQRLKSLEPSSKAALRSEHKAALIKHLLQPSGFLLKQIPDVLSSHPVTAALVGPNVVPDDVVYLGTTDASSTGNETSPAQLGHQIPMEHLLIEDKGDNVAGEENVAGAEIPGADERKARKSEQWREESVAEHPSLLDYSKGDPICNSSPLGPEVDACIAVPFASSGIPRMRQDVVPEAELRYGGEKRDTTRFAHLSKMKGKIGTVQTVRDSSGRERGPRAHWGTFDPNNDEERAFVNRFSVGEAMDARSNSEYRPREGAVHSEMFTETQRERPRADGVRHPDNCTAGRSDRHPRSIPSDNTYAAIVARIDSRRSPRTTPPGEVSMTSPFGPASRWGELSKAHLEFHRLSTAGILSWMAYPSLRRHCLPGRNVRGGHLLPLAKSFHLNGAEREAVAAVAAFGRVQSGASGCGTHAPRLHVTPEELARKREQVQVYWKERVQAFAEEQDASHRQSDQPPPEGSPSANRQMGRRRLGERGRNDRQQVELGVQGEAEGGIRTQTKFGPYSRNELEGVWKTFEVAQAFGTRVDARKLFKHPFFRENPQYHRGLLQMGSTNKRGPILIPREDALRILFPMLERPVARSFITLMKLMDEERKRLGEKAAEDESTASDEGELGTDPSKDEGEHGTDPAKMAELRALFALYDSDHSGDIEPREILAALRGNRALHKAAGRVWDTMTENEIAALISGTSRKATGDAVDQSEDGRGKTRPGLNFQDFCQYLGDVI